MKTPHALEKRAKDLLKPIRRRCGKNNPINAEFVLRARERFFASLDVKMAHLQRLNPNGIDREELKRLAERLDPFAPYRKPIPYYEIERADRSPRLVLNLPMALRATHSMAKEMVEAQVVPHRTVYGRRGKGRDHLVGDLRDILEGAPDAWVVLADVANCFQSVNPDALYDLQLLPDRIVEAALDVRHLRFGKKDRSPRNGGPPPRQDDGPPSSCHPVIRASEHAGLRGLMQGSPASNSILSVFFNDLHRRMPTGVAPFVISDNIAVVCRSEAECSAVCNALDDYLSHHSAGPLVLDVDFQGQAREGFDFLGYTFEWLDERLTVRHSSKNFIKAMRRLILHAENHDLAGDDALAMLLSGFGALTDDAIERSISIIDEAW